MKNILLKEETVLGLNKHIRLRREETSIILYWAIRYIGIDDEIDKSKLRYLSAATAMMLALFDGKRSIKEVFRIVKYIWNKPSLSFADFCKKLEEFIVKKSPPFNLDAPVLIEVTDNKKQKFMHYAPESFVINENIKGKKLSSLEDFPLKFPTSVLFMPTMSCFTNCVYCYMGRNIAPKYSSLPFSRWKELLKEMSEYQLGEIGFAGGDPMCYEHIIDMLEIISTFDPPTVFDVATKAYISPEIAQRLSCIPGLNFQISLDSIDPEIADAMVQKKGYGTRAIESLKNLMKAGIIPAVKAVVTPLNIKAMPQTILGLHNLGVYPIRVAGYARSIWCHQDALFNKASDWVEFEKRMEEIQKKHSFKIHLQGTIPEEDPSSQETFEKRKKAWDERSSCTLGKQQSTILPDGSLLGCEQIPQLPEYFLGSVAKDSLCNAWNSESFKKKAYDIPREKYKNTICYTCKEFIGCHSASGKGYCMRESYRLFGTIYAPDHLCPYNDKVPPRRY